MQPFPAPNSVIVMDNCQIHKHQEIQELIHERCVLFIYFVAAISYINVEGNALRIFTALLT
jgi:hypothetical protein